MSIIEMKVPTIGESVTEVTLSQWLKSNGAFVNIDEPICEFESDKATLEFPAEAAGKLSWVAQEGDDLEIGALVAKIDTSVKQENGAPSQKKEEAKQPVKEPEKSRIYFQRRTQRRCFSCQRPPKPCSIKNIEREKRRSIRITGNWERRKNYKRRCTKGTN